jgi:L-threonylcarbamoyladenylate synthase
MIYQAIQAIKKGGIIAYPTESVYGIGCDPFNQIAVDNLLQLKQRPTSLGLILVASHVQQILPLIQPQHADDLARALKTWPGHFTWVFPKSKIVPTWISGKHPSIAVRVSKHPTIVQLCNKLNAPLVSTSANISRHSTLLSIKEIKQTFGAKIQCYLDAPLGSEEKASIITDAHTLKLIR